MTGAAREKWQAERVAAHYAGERFKHARARGRDGRLIARLLTRHGPARIESLLDAPCGTGRLAVELCARSERYVGADVSPTMLDEFRAPRVVGDAAHLPFRSQSFDVVVCCRLLHHLDPGAELVRVTGELVRVSRGLVIASFWDAASWPGLRRSRGWRADTTGRRPISRSDLERTFAEAGARVVGHAASCRYVSMQTFVAVERI